MIGRILGSDLDNLIKSIAKNDSKYSRLFAVKQYRGNIKDIDREKFLKMINKYLKSWGMNKIVCLKRVRKRANKKRVDYPDLYEYGFKNAYNLIY